MRRNGELVGDAGEQPVHGVGRVAMSGPANDGAVRSPTVGSDDEERDMWFAAATLEMVPQDRNGLLGGVGGGVQAVGGVDGETHSAPWLVRGSGVKPFTVAGLRGWGLANVVTWGQQGGRTAGYG